MSPATRSDPHTGLLRKRERSEAIARCGPTLPTPRDSPLRYVRFGPGRATPLAAPAAAGQGLAPRCSPSPDEVSDGRKARCPAGHGRHALGRHRFPYHGHTSSYAAATTSKRFSSRASSRATPAWPVQCFHMVSRRCSPDSSYQPARLLAAFHGPHATRLRRARPPLRLHADARPNSGSFPRSRPDHLYELVAGCTLIPVLPLVQASRSPQDDDVL